MHVLRAGQFRRQRCRSCQAFLTFLAVLVGPEPILRRQPEFYWDILILVSTGSSRATVSRSTRCAAQVDRLSASELRRFTWPVAQLFFRKKNPIGQSKNSRTARKRKIPAGRSDRRAGKGGKRWASFTVFNVVKCTNKVAGRSGCPVSNPDPNNTIGLFWPQTITNSTKKRPTISEIMTLQYSFPLKGQCHENR